MVWPYIIPLSLHGPQFPHLKIKVVSLTGDAVSSKTPIGSGEAATAVGWNHSEGGDVCVCMCVCV